MIRTGLQCSQIPIWAGGHLMPEKGVLGVHLSTAMFMVRSSADFPGFYSITLNPEAQTL